MTPAQKPDASDVRLGADAAASGLLSDTLPKVSIGVPIFNAEKYLEQSLDSILSQTYRNFELIISDNASTDASAEICRRYVARDARVYYHRNSRNQGATLNFRKVVQLSSGQYFLWAAHDDMFAPEYVARCVEILQRYPDVALCYSKAIEINEEGKPLVRTEQILAADSPRAHQRFRELIRMDHSCESMFGVIRADVLKRTSIHGDFPDSDRCMLAEVALCGRFYQLPDLLFFHREHAEQVTRQFPSRQERMARLNPERHLLMVFPYFRQFREYIVAIQRTPLSRRERIRCYYEMMRWVRNNARRLIRDLTYFVVSLLRPCVLAYRQWRQV